MARLLARLGAALALPLLCSSSGPHAACDANGVCPKEEADDVAYMQGRLRNVLHSERADPSPKSDTEALGITKESASTQVAPTPTSTEPFCNRHGKTAAVVTDGFNSWRALVAFLESGGVNVTYVTRAGAPGTLEERITEAGGRNLGMLYVFIDNQVLSDDDLEYMEGLAKAGATVVVNPNFVSAEEQAAKFFFNLTITVTIRRFACTPEVVPASGAENCFATKRLVEGWSGLVTTVYDQKNHEELSKCANKGTRILTTNPEGDTIDFIRTYWRGKVIQGGGIMLSLSGWGGCAATTLTADQQRLVRNLWDDAACH